IPFSAGLLGRYANNEIAVLVYGCNMFVCVFLRYSMWRYATKDHRLVSAGLDPEFISFNARLALFPLITYLIAILLTMVSLWKGISTWFSLILYIITPIPYILGLSYRRLYRVD
ncbi:MAG: hypothetical protein JOZ18_04545, partial [Chloroflexi bacterium]|nr:hypothetical protein [Chloroflexota bacterium]